MKRIISTVLIALMSLMAVSVSFAEVFHLRDGGRIDGEWLNPDESPRKTYKIRTGTNIDLELEAQYVERTRKDERESFSDYRAIVPFKEDTIENHIEIAAWCRKELQLPDQSTLHLERVIEMDPNHKEARTLLGYQKQSDGSWITQTERHQKRGYILDGGRWRTQQQIDVERIQQEGRKRVKDWDKKLNTMRNDPKERAMIPEINDPTAVGPLKEALASERNSDIRILYLRALANIATRPAIQLLALWSMEPNTTDDVRRACFDLLKKNEEALPAIIGVYSQFLIPNPDEGPEKINRAAKALMEVNGRSAIPQLIEVLVTEQKVIRVIQSPAPALGGANIGMAQGQQVVSETKVHYNADVRTALMRMTGVDFRYDITAWKNWLFESRRTPAFNPRRG